MPLRLQGGPLVRVAPDPTLINLIRFEDVTFTNVQATGISAGSSALLEILRNTNGGSVEALLPAYPGSLGTATQAAQYNFACLSCTFKQCNSDGPLIRLSQATSIWRGGSWQDVISAGLVVSESKNAKHQLTMQDVEFRNLELQVRNSQGLVWCLRCSI